MTRSHDCTDANDCNPRGIASWSSMQWELPGLKIQPADL
jgi:hypothetical protein